MTQNNRITWDNFATCNPNTEEKFEQMCRLIFKLQYFDDKAIFQNSPNNPGIEIEPVTHQETGKKISFQAKYFRNRLDYPNILHSAQKTVEYYNGNIDIFYLYSNKDLDKTCDSYKKIEEHLANHNIEFIPITNQEILNELLSNDKYNKLWSYFFNYHKIDKQWFNDKLDIAFKDLGPRYNKDLNVEIPLEAYFPFIYKNSKCLEGLNEKKNQAIDELAKLREKISTNKQISHLWEQSDLLINESIASIKDCTKINDFVKLQQTISNQNTSFSKMIHQCDETNIKNNNRLLLYDFENALNLLALSNEEINAIENQTIIIEGEAGKGKSHLLASIADNYKEDEYTILLLGHKFLNENLVENQILENLDMMRYSFQDFLEILEVIGLSNDKNIVLMIDAINESTRKDIWKSGLMSLIEKITGFPHIRLILSCRSSQRKLVFNESILEDGKITWLKHNGFENNFYEAINAFFNHYNISFQPVDILYHELSNPLFLSIYCKTQDRESKNLFSLFDSYIKEVDNKIKNELDLHSLSMIILSKLIDNIAGILIENGKESISETELLTLDFWSSYGINDKLKYIEKMEYHEILFHAVHNNDMEYYHFAYQKMTDYFRARYLLSKYEEDELKLYIKNTLMKIKDGSIENKSGIEVYNTLSALHTNEYKQEFIDISNELTDDGDIIRIRSAYIASYAWRRIDYINPEDFFKFVFFNNKIYLDIINEMWKVLICVSIRENHPLNADELHHFLINKDLNKRDYIWTIYINNLNPTENREAYIVDLLYKQQVYLKMSKEETRLLAVLLSWFLTSSNRFLRDKATKSLVEILKNNFELCENLLKQFENVNDPYILERLYAAVFGACAKKMVSYEEEYKQLVLYVYNQIFNKDKVYPHILLRDYAKSIIELYIYEYPENDLNINANKIKPPYNSDNIPSNITAYILSNESCDNQGSAYIDISMKTQGVGMYGDFGRYIFESELSVFENIDLNNLRNYALSYITNELKYEDNYFSTYDYSLSCTTRHNVLKIERVGKKYQWLALHNILARVSDHHKVKSLYDSDIFTDYTGPWNLYIRDIDPTLNIHTLKNNNEITSFKPKCFHIEWGNDEDLIYADAQKWIEDGDLPFFKQHNEKLVYEDIDKNEWILLNEYSNKQSRDDIYSSTKSYKPVKRMFTMSNAYIIKKGDYDKLKRELDNESFYEKWFPERIQTNSLFNRESILSECLDDEIGGLWHDYEVDTGKTREIEINSPEIIFDSFGDNISFTIPAQDTYTEEIKECLFKFMPAYVSYSWGNQYDASNVSSWSNDLYNEIPPGQTAFTIPAKDIICKLELKQKIYDGYFYCNDELVAFDLKFAFKNEEGLLIRKDYIMKYLEQNNSLIFWTCLGENEVWRDNSSSKQQYAKSEWRGFYELTKDGAIIGDFFVKNKFNNF